MLSKVFYGENKFRKNRSFLRGFITNLRSNERSYYAAWIPKHFNGVQHRLLRTV